MLFTRAIKLEAKLSLALAAPSGAGKTYTALQLATHLGGPIAGIDTERGSASKYADLFTFDVIELNSFHPHRYIDAIKEAEAGCRQTPRHAVPQWARRFLRSLAGSDSAA